MSEAFDAQSLLASLTELPGVYRMLDGSGVANRGISAGLRGDNG